MLIMADTRFHDGLRNIGIASFPYPPERCVAYPEYLEEVPGCSPVLIQEFFVKLGVNLYFNKTLEHYGDDSDYIDSLCDFCLESFRKFLSHIFKSQE